MIAEEKKWYSCKAIYSLYINLWRKLLGHREDTEKSVVHVGLKAQVSRRLGLLCIWCWPLQSVSRCIPRYSIEGAGEQLRQPEGVWPDSHVVGQGHISPLLAWPTPPPDFLFVCLCLSLLAPSQLLSRELREQDGMKSGIVLCWLQAEWVCVWMCVCVSFFYSSAMQLCRHHGLGMPRWSQEQRTCFNQRHMCHVSICQGPVSHATHAEHAFTVLAAWFAA